MSQKLSFGMIVRDEAAHIAQCLDSISEICDEIIVIDTGSVDDTIALAQAHGAIVRSFPWCDDFSAAYNFMLDQLTGDWAFCLDADEWLLPECRLLVRPLIEDPTALAYNVMRQEMEREDQTHGFVEMRQLRLCRNLRGVRTTGKDHPQFGDQLIRYADAHGLHIRDSRIIIRHSGYLPSKKQAKLLRAVKLLQDELAARPGQLYYEIELGRTWEMLGDPRGPELLDALTNGLLGSRAKSPPAPLAMTLLERALRQPLSHDKTGRVIRLALRWFPDSPPILDAVAACYYAQGEFEKAIPLLGKLAAITESGGYDRALAFSSRFLGEDVWLNLAVCYHRLADLDTAERWYRKVLEQNPDHPGAQANLSILQEQRRLV